MSYLCVCVAVVYTLLVTVFPFCNGKYSQASGWFKHFCGVKKNQFTIVSIAHKNE
jgi:hypothetical protein